MTARPPCRSSTKWTRKHEANYFSPMRPRTGASVLSASQTTTELAGAQCGHEVEVRLEAAVDLDGCIAGAEDAFALAPDGEIGNLLTKESVETLDHPVIEAYGTQSAAIGIESGGQVKQARQGLEMLWRKAPIFHLGSNQHPVRNRLGRNACQDRPPIIEGELGQGHDGDRK